MQDARNGFHKATSGFQMALRWVFSQRARVLNTT
jgi:hypothetical protein